MIIFIKNENYVYKYGQDRNKSALTPLQLLIILWVDHNIIRYWCRWINWPGCLLQTRENVMQSILHGTMILLHTVRGYSNHILLSNTLASADIIRIVLYYYYFFFEGINVFRFHDGHIMYTRIHVWRRYIIHHTRTHIVYYV